MVRHQLESPQGTPEDWVPPLKRKRVRPPAPQIEAEDSSQESEKEPERSPLRHLNGTRKPKSSRNTQLHKQVHANSDDWHTSAPSDDTIVAPVTVEKFLQGLAQVSPTCPKKYGRRNRRAEADERIPLRFKRVPVPNAEPNARSVYNAIPSGNHSPEPDASSDSALPTFTCLEPENEDATANDSDSSNNSLFNEKPAKKKKKKVVRAWTTLHPKHGVPMRAPSFSTWQGLQNGPKQPQKQASHISSNNRGQTNAEGIPQLSFVPLAEAEKAYKAKFSARRSGG